MATMESLEWQAGITGEIPRFDDGMVNMAELIRAMAESLVNEIMGARADEACEAGNQRNSYRERSSPLASAPSTSGSRSCARRSPPCPAS